MTLIMRSLVSLKDKFDLFFCLNSSLNLSFYLYISIFSWVSAVFDRRGRQKEKAGKYKWLGSGLFTNDWSIFFLRQCSCKFCLSPLLGPSCICLSFFLKFHSRFYFEISLGLSKSSQFKNFWNGLSCNLVLMVWSNVSLGTCRWWNTKYWRNFWVS